MVVAHLILFVSAFTYSIYCVIPAGEYLALTGEKLNGVDMLAVGLATHFSMSAVCTLLHFFLNSIRN